MPSARGGPQAETAGTEGGTRVPQVCPFQGPRGHLEPPTGRLSGTLPGRCHRAAQSQGRDVTERDVTEVRLYRSREDLVLRAGALGWRLVTRRPFSA